MGYRPTEFYQGYEAELPTNDDLVEERTIHAKEIKDRRLHYTLLLAAAFSLCIFGCLQGFCHLFMVPPLSLPMSITWALIAGIVLSAVLSGNLWSSTTEKRTRFYLKHILFLIAFGITDTILVLLENKLLIVIFTVLLAVELVVCIVSFTKSERKVFLPFMAVTMLVCLIAGVYLVMFVTKYHFESAYFYIVTGEPVRDEELPSNYAKIYFMDEDMPYNAEGFYVYHHAEQLQEYIAQQRKDVADQLRELLHEYDEAFFAENDLIFYTVYDYGKHEMETQKLCLLGDSLCIVEYIHDRPYPSVYYMEIAYRCLTVPKSEGLDETIKYEIWFQPVYDPSHYV